MILIIPFLPLIAAGVATGGGILGASLNRSGSRRAIDRQNEYNSPASQLQRIREAGLPYAAMTNAIAGNQSVAQESQSGVGEALKGGIDTFIQTTMQQKQLEAIDKELELKQAQIDATHADTRTKNIGADILNIDYDLKRDRAYNYDLIGGDGINVPAGSSNQIMNAVREQEIKKVDNYLRENQSKAIELEMDIKRARNPLEMDEIRQRIKNMIGEMGIKYEDLKMRKEMQPFNIKEAGQKITNMKLEAGMYPLREHQLVLSNRQSYHQTQLNSITDKLIQGMKQDGLSIGEAFFHSIFTGSLRANPFNLR